ncbi:hypothetical protein AB0J86_06980 [Micromonospora sp. NPDC049559]|uniref:hypothetical protein n=1 Tax=Micromonospora sp. NPDC049559 TaxID=3155923 RepID=UPI0034183281
MIDDTPTGDPVEDAHRAMREHVADGGRWCRCGSLHPCSYRRDARSLLIRVGRLVLPGTAPRRSI